MCALSRVELPSTTHTLTFFMQYICMPPRTLPCADVCITFARRNSDIASSCYHRRSSTYPPVVMLSVTRIKQGILPCTGQLAGRSRTYMQFGRYTLAPWNSTLLLNTRVVSATPGRKASQVLSLLSRPHNLQFGR